MNGCSGGRGNKKRLTGAEGWFLGCQALVDLIDSTCRLLASSEVMVLPWVLRLSSPASSYDRAGWVARGASCRHHACQHDSLVMCTRTCMT